MIGFMKPSTEELQFARDVLRQSFISSAKTSVVTVAICAGCAEAKALVALEDQLVGGCTLRGMC